MTRQEKDSVLHWATVCTQTERLGFLKSFFDCLEDDEIKKTSSILCNARKKRKRAACASDLTGELQGHSDEEISPAIKNSAPYSVPRKQNIEFSSKEPSWSKCKDHVSLVSDAKIMTHLEKNSKCDERNVKVFIGNVTEVQSNFGMVGDVFFLKRTVKGVYPRLGDRVVVEAEPVLDMPFKWNSIRVMLVDEELKTKHDKEDQLLSKTTTVVNSSDNVRVRKKIAPPPPCISGLPNKKKFCKIEDPESELRANVPVALRPPPPPIISNGGLLPNPNFQGFRDSIFSSSAVPSSKETSFSESDPRLNGRNQRRNSRERPTLPAFTKAPYKF